MIVDEMLPDFERNSALGRNETCRDNDSSLSAIFQAIKKVLEEAQVNLHSGLVLVRDVRDTGEKTSFIWVIDQIAMIIREVQLERRVADYVVEFPQRAVLILVERVFQSISLNHVSQRMAHTVKDKIQHHHSRRLVADVLGIDRAVLFPYFVSQSNHERTSTGRRLK